MCAQYCRRKSSVQKNEDKHFFPPYLLKCISISKKIICNDENLLSHIIKDITFRAYIINQQVGE